MVASIDFPAGAKALPREGASALLVWQKPSVTYQHNLDLPSALHLS